MGCAYVHIVFQKSLHYMDLFSYQVHTVYVALKHTSSHSHTNGERHVKNSMPLRWRGIKFTFWRCTGNLNDVGTTPALSLVVCPVLSKHDCSKWSEQSTLFFEGLQLSRFMLITHFFKISGWLNGKLKHMERNSLNTLFFLSFDFFAVNKIRTRGIIQI